MWMLFAVALAAAPLATVDGVAITEDDVAAALMLVDPGARDGIDPAAVVDELVVRQLLAAEAQKREIAGSPEAKAAVARATREAISSVLLQRVLAERLGPDAIARYYETNRSRYLRDEVHARHILVATEDEARGVLTALQGGAEFATVAAERSLDPGSRANGGDLGWFSKERMVPAFAEAAFGARTGATVGPVQTQFGWHLIEVVDRRDQVPLPEATADIRAELQPQVLSAYVAELKARARITVASPRALLQPIPTGPSLPAAARASRTPAVTVVAFIDMQCPHCHEMHLALDRLAAARPDVRVVYRHYPLEKTCNPAVERTGRILACESARAAICADGNDALAADLLANGDVLDRAALVSAGPRHGVSAKRWEACLQGPEAAATLARDVAEGASLGIEGTPTVYLRGEGSWYRLEGGSEDLGEAVGQVLAAP